MLETEHSETRFSSDLDIEEEEGYRPLSPLAIVALIAALVSVAATLHPLLWFLPVVGIVLAVTSILSLSRANNLQGGQALAKTALVISLFIAGYAPARALSMQQSMYHQARVCGDHWIDLVRHNRLQEAHQLTVPFPERYAGDLSLNEYYADQVSLVMRKNAEQSGNPLEKEMMEYAMQSGIGEIPSAKLAKFQEYEVVARLQKLPQDAVVQCVREVSQLKKGRNLLIELEYLARYVENGQTKEYKFPLRLTRKYSFEDADRYWEIGRFAPPPIKDPMRRP